MKHEITVILDIDASKLQKELKRVAKASGALAKALAALPPGVRASMTAASLVAAARAQPRGTAVTGSGDWHPPEASWSIAKLIQIERRQGEAGEEPLE